jgi:hypothetical protein
MVHNQKPIGEEREPWDAQFERIKKVLDSIAYEIVKEADDADFYDTMDLDKILVQADAHYATFTSNNGYARLSMYNGFKNIENKKKIKLNPYRWLRARSLGPDNEYYIEEVYD